MMTVVEESDKSPVTGGCQIGPKMNGPGQFDTTTSLLAQAQLVDMYSCEVRFSYYSLFIPGPVLLFFVYTRACLTILCLYQGLRLAQAQLVDMYSCEVRLSYYCLFIPGPEVINLLLSYDFASGSEITPC